MNRIRLIALALTLALLLCSCTTTGNEATHKPTEQATQSAQTASPATEEPLYFNESGYPIVDDPITLKITGCMTALATTWEGNLQLDFLTRLTGIEFDPEGIMPDAWEQQKSLMFASDSLPDLFVNGQFTAAELLEYGSEGQIIALNDLVEKYGQNIQIAFEEIPLSKAIATSGDGNMYTLPRINQVVRDMHNRYWFNKKWADNLGLTVPTTLDELYTVLKAFLEQDANGNGDPNDEIPLSGILGGSSYDGLVLNAMGVNVRSGGYGITATPDGTVYCANISDAYKEYLKYMNRLFKEKLLDNDFFIQTQEQLVSKAQQNIIGGCCVAAMYITANTDIGYDYIQIDALTSALNQTKMVTASTGISIGYVAITNVNKYPEATLRLLDYFYTEEGGRVAYVGEEGVGWYWIDKEAGTWDKMQPEGYKTAEDFRNSVATIQTWGGWERPEFNAGQGSQNAFWLNEMSFRDSYPYFVTEFPKNYLPLSEEDSETVATIETDVSSYIAESRARFISGEDDIDAVWDTYVQNVKNAGIDTVVSIYQQYYDAFVASME